MSNKTDESSNEEKNSEQKSTNDDKKSITMTANKKKVSPLKIMLHSFLWTLLAIIIIYCSIPLIFHYSITVRKLLLFMNYVNLQPLLNIQRPMIDYDLNCTKSFYITSEDGVKLGAWHIYPGSRLNECKTEMLAEDDFNDNRPIFFYLHGNGGTRGGYHRRDLYRVFAYSKEIDAHVIAIDYRGYGDSSNMWPSATGLYADSMTAYKWLTVELKIPPRRINVWGHSLGSAVAVHLAANIENQLVPNTLIIEAPFTNVGDVSRWYPLGKIYSWNHVIFEWLFVTPLLKSNQTYMNPEDELKNVRSSTLVLHAEDDRIIPIHLGKRMYNAALKNSKSTKKPEMVVFEGRHGYGHKYIVRDKQLPMIIAKFIGKSD